MPAHTRSTLRGPVRPASVALCLGMGFALCIPQPARPQANPGASPGPQQPPATANGLPGAPQLTLESLPRPAAPPIEGLPVVPAQVERWRDDARAFELGDGYPRDPLRAAELYCRAARHGDAESRYSLGWMYANGRGIERDDAAAAHLFAAAAEQGLQQLQNNDFSKIQEILPKFMEEANKHPVFQGVDVNLKFNKPELVIEVDKEKAKTLGVSIADLAQTLQLALSGQRFGYFIMNDRQYQIIGQVDRENRDDPLDLSAFILKITKVK